MYIYIYVCIYPKKLDEFKSQCPGEGHGSPQKKKNALPLFGQRTVEATICAACKFMLLGPLFHLGCHATKAKEQRRVSGTYMKVS